MLRKSKTQLCDRLYGAERAGWTRVTRGSSQRTSRHPRMFGTYSLWANQSRCPMSAHGLVPGKVPGLEGQEAGE